MQIGERVRRELLKRRGRQRVDEQIRQPALQRRKHDARAVRRPARVVDLAETRRAGPRRAARVRTVSRMTSTGLPSLSAAIAKRPPDASHAPDESMYCRLSKCGSAAVLTILRMIRPLARLRQEQVERQPIPFGNEHDLPPVRAERRREMQAGAVAVERGDSMGGAVALARPRRPPRPKSTSCHACEQRVVVLPGRLANPRERAARLRSQDLAENVVAVAGGQERPERVAVAVREVLRVVELLERRQPVVRRGVAQPHRRVAIAGAERQVLGHAFDEPAGQDERVLPGAPSRCRSGTRARSRGRARGRSRRGRRQTASRCATSSARSGRRCPRRRGRRDVGLSEMRVARVEHQRLPPRETVVQHAARSARTSARPSAPHGASLLLLPGSNRCRSGRSEGRGNRGGRSGPCCGRSTALRRGRRRRQA